MSINVQNANAYFAAHVLGRAWNDYSAAQKDSAIMQAKRELSKALGRALKEDEPAYKFGERRRDEYAAYEQAVYLLLRDVQPEGGGELTPAIGEAAVVQRTVPNAVCKKWSQDALNWLGDRISFTIAN